MSASDKSKLDGLQNYSLPTASASTLGGVKVGTGLSIDGSGVLSSASASAAVIASAPAYYQRESLATPAKTTLTIHPTWVNINNVGYISTLDVVLDLTNAATWDSSIYATAANRAGHDFYIYACVPVSGDAPDFILSANSTIPTGYTASNSRKIGGFHCLCVDVGTISVHTLSGYVAGDILPASIWDLKHRAVSENEGMVWVPGAGKWVDIYLPSWQNGGMASVYGGTIVDGESTININGELAVEYFGLVGKEVISRAEFMVAMAGSNQGTNIYGSADPVTTGGHKDINNRRMISNYGVEDGCGVVWQWGRDLFENYPDSTWETNNNWLSGYAWQTKPVYNSDIESISKGQCYGLLRRVLLGSYWLLEAYCGTRAAGCHSFSAHRAGSYSSRGVSSLRRMA
jgi:hypothetical protein